MDKYYIFGDRDENRGILIITKFTLGGALATAADYVEHWDSVTVAEKTESGDFKQIALISLKGL